MIPKVPNKMKHQLRSMPNCDNNFDRLIACLQKQRKIFHSEDDLKMALAMVIRQNHPTAVIRLERPVNIEMIDRNNKKSTVRAPIDILVIDSNSSTIPIELKYKTKKTNTSESG